MKRVWTVGLVCVALSAFLGGCSQEAVSKDATNSFLTSTDLTTMTDQMAASIVSDPDVARVIAQKPMIIVMKPIQNETNEIIPPAEKELYVHRVRVLLSGKPQLRKDFEFVLNRADYEKLKAEEGVPESALGASEDRVQPEYALTGTFYANTNASSKRRSDTYLCTFRLTKLSGPDAGLQLWEGKYETSKRITKGLLD